MATVAERFQEKGFGLVAMAGFVEDADLRYRCYSTVSKNDVYCVLESVAANVSLMPHDLASLMTGDFVVSPPSPDLCEMASWGAEFVDRHEPLIVAAVSESTFAAFVVGDGPMIVYMAVRMITTLKQNGGLVLNPFTPSMN
jgi:hypothetical protein